MLPTVRSTLDRFSAPAYGF